uniref:Putative secreted protein n=1 Tax=Anopheles darlingi TaxID=43151 RepID=A0A2M4DGP8_ANODA
MRTHLLATVVLPRSSWSASTRVSPWASVRASSVSALPVPARSIWTMCASRRRTFWASSARVTSMRPVS